MRTLAFLAIAALLALSAPATLADHGEDDLPLTCIPEDPWPCWCGHNLVRCLTTLPEIDACRVGDQYIC